MNFQPIKISLSKLAEVYLPFGRNIWINCETPITREEIELAIANQQLQAPSKLIPMYLIWDMSTRQEHINRIAWLVVNFDHDNPIDIDFGIPGYTEFNIQDGNHRLLAAYYLKMSYILADCAGDVKQINRYQLNKN